MILIKVFIVLAFDTPLWNSMFHLIFSKVPIPNSDHKSSNVFSDVLEHEKCLAMQQPNKDQNLVLLMKSVICQSFATHFASPGFDHSLYHISLHQRVKAFVAMQFLSEFYLPWGKLLLCGGWKSCSVVLLLQGPKLCSILYPASSSFLFQLMYSVFLMIQILQQPGRQLSKARQKGWKGNKCAWNACWCSLSLAKSNFFIISAAMHVRIIKCIFF